MGQLLREHVRKNIQTLIGDDVMGINIEKSILNSSIRSRKRFADPTFSDRSFVTLYKCTALGIIHYIRNPNNHILDRIKSGELVTSELAHYSPDVLSPNGPYAIAKKCLEMKRAKPEDIPDGIFKCSKCKSLKTSYFQLQTRSADEPMTNFHSCFNCGKKWRT
jgi:transcription elongation factor S-II